MSQPAPQLSAEAKANLPTHVAIIMDGNGRWAKQRGLPGSADCQSAVSADWQSAGRSNTGSLADCQSTTRQTAGLRYFGGRPVARIPFALGPA
jgi:hypothetical protein